MLTSHGNEPGKIPRNAGRTAKDKQDITRRLIPQGQVPYAAQIDAVAIVERGLSTSSVADLRAMGFTPGELQSLVIPARTLKHRVDKKQRLSLEETDRVLRLIKIAAMAVSVFSNHDKAFGWLRGSNERLAGRAPLDLLRSEVGGDLVRQMLVQIDDGIFV